MSTMKAVVLAGDARVEVRTDRPVPKLRPRYIMIKVNAVALNPTDWKHVDLGNTRDSLSGCDYAGVVTETGTGYNKAWNVGDRIAGFAHGGNQLQLEDGAFAEYVVAVADIQLKIPDYMSDEEAATLGVATITCGQGLFSSEGLGLNWPDNPVSDGETILIYGGSSATGTMGIQLAKLAGYTVLTTCSTRNFDLVKSLGADQAFDYKDPECAEKIKKATGNKLTKIWDTIALDSTVEICNNVISPGGIYASLLVGVELPRKDVESRFTLGYTVTGERIEKPFINNFERDDTTEDFNFTLKFVSLMERLLAERKIKTHPMQVSKAGLDGVIEGMDLMRNDKVSGQKLVYTL